MAKRSKIYGVVFLAVFTLTTLLFNNCQPIGEQHLIAGLSQDSSNGGGGPGAVNDVSGSQYFNASVKPMFESRCNTCHALPINGGTAPITIFTYTTMKALVVAGPSATNNPLINRMRNIVAHTGGDQCPGDVNGSVSPCKEVVLWATLEDPTLATGVAGLIVNVDVIGRVRGWSVDPAQPDTPVDVSVYVGGPVGTGQLVATVKADLAGNGVQDGHYFNLQLDAQYRDGVERDFYFYGGTPSANTLLPGMPVKITAYSQTTAGRDYFNNTVKPALTQCMGCHVVDYDVQWYYLVDPTPAKGGTVTNNTLINKASGMNHSGGVRCSGGKNSSPCSLFQTWWNLEFN